MMIRGGMMSARGTLVLALASVLSGAALAEPVKIGMITTLSGGGAGLGVDTRDGFMLAIEEAANPDVEVVIEDDGQRPELAVQIADKMIQSDDVDILTGIVWSNLAMAVVPSALAQGKFYLSTNAGPSQLAGPGCHENYFNVAYQNDNLHEAAGNYASESGYQSTFIMAPNYPAGTDALTGFKRYYKGELAGEIYTQVGQTDYAAEIAQIRDSGADSLFIFLPGGMGISFMKQYTESGVDIPVIGPAFSFDQDILGALGDTALGVMNTAQWSPRISTPKRMPPSSKPSRASMIGFRPFMPRRATTTARLMLAALEQAPVSDADGFRAALKAADFDSVRGEFQFASNNHPIQDIYVREVVKDGDVLTNRIVGVALEDRANEYVDQCSLQ
jgi:branched-chain amino acid transport system substrate-binding protein